MQRLVKCPKCENGKMVITVHHSGQLGTSVVNITCTTCNGRGVIPNVELQRQQKADREFWCRCGNPSRNVSYHEDNSQSATCTKHHWTCDDCGKVAQVG